MSAGDATTTSSTSGHKIGVLQAIYLDTTTDGTGRSAREVALWSRIRNLRVGRAPLAAPRSTPQRVRNGTSAAPCPIRALRSRSVRPSPLISRDIRDIWESAFTELTHGTPAVA